jgi:hypothetical protein
MEAIFLPYAAQRACAWPFKALILASSTLGMSLLAAPLAWYQVGSMLTRMFNTGHSQDQLLSTLAPHIISLPAELMLLTSIAGVLMALVAKKQALAMAIQGPLPRVWLAGITFGLLSNLAAIVANGLCLLGG